jgi:hypothetical protein
LDAGTTAAGPFDDNPIAHVVGSCCQSDETITVDAEQEISRQLRNQGFNLPFIDDAQLRNDYAA